MAQKTLMSPSLNGTNEESVIGHEVFSELVSGTRNRSFSYIFLNYYSNLLYMHVDTIKITLMND